MLQKQSGEGIRKIAAGTNNLNRADQWLSNYEGLCVCVEFVQVKEKNQTYHQIFKNNPTI